MPDEAGRSALPPGAGVYRTAAYERVMAGYSGTPLAAKLGIKAGARVALVHAPDDFEAQFAVVFFVVLLGTNIYLNPARFRLDTLGTVFGLAAPLILAALCLMASTAGRVRIIRSTCSFFSAETAMATAR